jgi:hypothetical protein
MTSARACSPPSPLLAADAGTTRGHPKICTMVGVHDEVFTDFCTACLREHLQELEAFVLDDRITIVSIVSLACKSRWLW